MFILTFYIFYVIIVKMKRLLIALTLLISSTSLCDEYFLGYGLGVFGSADYSPAQVKTINLGYRSYFFPGFYLSYKAGFWADNSPEIDRKNSFYGSIGAGMKVNVRPMEFRAGWGLAVISNTDSYLGGIFPQFNGELYAGFRDETGHGIGLDYEHISSSGLVMPNRGRDFLLLQLSLKTNIFEE